MSTVGPINDGTGGSAQFGNVDVYGCSSNADTETVDPDGNRLDTPKGTSPGVFSVYFAPSSGTWLIYNFKTLVNRDGTVVEGRRNVEATGLGRCRGDSGHAVCRIDPSHRVLRCG